MSRKKKPFPVLENITITDVAAEGKALTRVGEMVVFIPFAVPGDIVDLQIKKKKHSYCEAEGVTHSSNWNYTTLKQRGGYDERSICTKHRV